MPKKFPEPPDPVVTTFDPQCNIHPAAVESPAESLTDMLFDRAPEVEIADYLRTEFDEPNGKLMASWLVMMVDSLPHFWRAYNDGENATFNRIKAEELLSTLRLSRPSNFSVAGLAEHQQMIADAEGELRKWGLLDACRQHASCGLGVISGVAPTLYADPRASTAAEQPLSPRDEIAQRRLTLENYAVEHKLEIEVVDGWPRSLRPMHGTAGRVIIRTVERVPKGLRLP